MNKAWATIFIIVISVALVSSFPARSTRRQKRQSDQRIAELETLLALKKYGLRRGHKTTGDSDTPGYGLIDFNLIGRKKKSMYSQLKTEDESNLNPWILARSSSKTLDPSIYYSENAWKSPPSSEEK